jgi:hypothetical protein
MPRPAPAPRPLAPRPAFRWLTSAAVGARVVVGDPPVVGVVELVRRNGDAVVRCADSRVIEVPPHLLRAVVGEE